MAKKPKKLVVYDGNLVLFLEPAEEGGYCVTCPYEPGLITEAETIDEAFEMAYDVMALFEQYQASSATQADRNASQVR